MNKKINIRIIFLFIYTFVVLFMPNLSYYLGIGSFTLVGILTIPYLLKFFATKNKNFISMLNSKVIIIYFLFNILLSLIYAVRTMIAGTEFTDIGELRIIQHLMPIFYIITSLVIVAECKNMNLSKEEIYKLIIKVALLQGIICMLMIYIKPLRNIAINIFYTNHEYNQYITRSRLYGICDGDYTYSFQIMMAVLALASYVYASTYKEKKYFIFSIIILFGTILNGRTGIAIYVLGVAIYTMHNTIARGKIFSIIKPIIALSLIMPITIYLLYKYVPNTYLLLEHGVRDFVSFIKEGSSTTESSALFSRMLFWPSGIGGIIFGKGFRVFGGKGVAYGEYRSSDIGFVNDMFMGGIVYVLILYICNYWLVRKIKKNKYASNYEKEMSFLLPTLFIMINYKGEFFRSQMILSLFIMLTIALLMGGYQFTKKEQEYSE